MFKKEREGDELINKNPNFSIDKNKKVKLGQYFTKESLWLKPQVKQFIENCKCNVAYDPFAGDGDLLKVASNTLKFKQIKGLDIDNSLNWEENDSLLSIPHIDNAIIITNPPYIAKQSASRKGIDLSKYFDSTKYDDVYLIALDKMLIAQNYVVAIIPESFLNSSYMQKNKLYSVTILEENPFEDTENPVCVACFDSINKELKDVKVYKNEIFINNFENLQKLRIEPTNKVDITFNTLNGWLGLRAIDSTDDIIFINFDFKEKFNYDWDKNIKVSSRNLSLIDIKIPDEKKEEFIKNCNQILRKLRKESADIIFSPFKGNTKKGIRRRRLDFRLARAIMEQAYFKMFGGENMKKARTSKLLVGIACLGTLASCNKNINPIDENDYSNYSEYQINNLSDFYSQDEEIYTIYFYDKNDSNCELIKSDILNYLDEYKNDKKHLKLYLYDYSKISDDTSSFLKNNQDYKTNKKYMIENNYIDNIKDTIINRASSLYVIKYNGLIDYYEDKDISEFLFNNNYDSRDYSIFKDYKLDSLDNFYSLKDEKYMIYLYYDQCPYCFKIRGKIYDYLLSEHNIKLYPFNMFSSASEFGIEYRAKFKNIANNKEEIENEKNIEINEGVCELKDTLFVGVPALYIIEKNKLNDFICGSEEIVEYINNLK